ncbi:MAG: hypothetical protein HYY20_08740 [Candidatus Tectomicrobia bacterium]|uniref:Hydantoinase/oxoprolinase N-terminal domain-containing protein n=1 Tax=Tectimicrobiota bacterium TaxID=2528274 RepID=A0A932G171_UNCTE|nr:hypothetical protein [Candidatus Tectomicrobia bacterium]
MGYSIDIDTGGTFTDGFFVRGERVETVKVPTTPHDLTVCFLECIRVGGRLLRGPPGGPPLRDGDCPLLQHHRDQHDHPAGWQQGGPPGHRRVGGPGLGGGGDEPGAGTGPAGRRLCGRTGVLEAGAVRAGGAWRPPEEILRYYGRYPDPR